MPQEGSLAAVLFGMVVAEAGFVAASVPLTIAATEGVGEGERRLASGILSTSTELGNALGWAGVAAVIAATAADAILGGLLWGLWAAIVCAALALVFVLVFMRSEPGASQRKESGPASGRDTEFARE